jgi:hypothetical protein
MHVYLGAEYLHGDHLDHGGKKNKSRVALNLRALRVLRGDSLEQPYANTRVTRSTSGILRRFLIT